MFEDTKGITRRGKSKDKQQNGQQNNLSVTLVNVL